MRIRRTDHGKTFSPARLVVTYSPFVSEQFTGSSARECGDGPLAYPTGFTFPRFDLASPFLATDDQNIYSAALTPYEFLPAALKRIRG